MERITEIWRVVKRLLLGSLSFILLLELTAIVRTPAWELLDLLIIPAVLAVGVWWLNKRQRENEQKIARNRQQQDSLERYFDRMSELLLDHELKKADLSEKGGNDVYNIARARTLSILAALDSDRKVSVIRFLSEARLIEKDTPGISLYGANLEKVDLRTVGFLKAVLEGVNLRFANLQGANLKKSRLSSNMEEANLERADLTEAWVASNLDGANLQSAHMQASDVQARLANADLRNADLKWSWFHPRDLQGAKMLGARLQGADLRFANLEGADLNGAVYSIGEYGTKWPDGFDPQEAGAILEEDWDPTEEATKYWEWD